MGDYTISITFTDDQVRRLNEGKFKLGFTSGVGSNPAFNVVALATEVSKVVNIEWKAEYKISASKDEFSNGVKISHTTTPTTIQFQQDYTLPPDWTDGSISADTNLNAESFKFINNTDGQASAVIHKVINGELKPFYVSPSPVASKKEEILTPTLIVALWVQKITQSGTMIAKNESRHSKFDMTNSKSLELTWNGDIFIKA